MRKLTLENNYAPFTKGYYMHILYLVMPIAYFIAHSVLELSYKEVERGMTLIQIEFESSIPYLPFLSLTFFLCVGASAAVLIFLMIKDVCAFKRYSIYLFIGLFIGIIISACFPNYNTLMPNISSDNSFFGGLMKIIYGYDANTNNFPSAITIVAISLVYATHDSKTLNFKWLKILSICLAVVFSLSTLFIKLNSIYDLLGAGAVCLVMLLPISLVKKRDNLKLGEERFKTYGEENPFALHRRY